MVEFVDIAGLVAGACKGEGLGNQFLANIRETDAIAHVVRCFVDDNVVHVAGKIDPLSDIETINTELALADLATVEKTMARYAKVAKSGDKEAQRIMAVLEKVLPVLNQARPARSLALSREEQQVLQPLCLMTAKPAMYVANVDENGFSGNPLLARVQEYAKAEGAPVVAICAAIEAQMADLDDEEKKIFLADMGLDEPGLDRLIRAGYAAARPADLLHRRREGSARLDHPGRRDRAAGRRRDPHRLRARLHPRRGDCVTTTSSPARASRARRKPARCGSKARSTSCATATSCTFASTSASTFAPKPILKPPNGATS